MPLAYGSLQPGLEHHEERSQDYLAMAAPVKTTSSISESLTQCCPLERAVERAIRQYPSWGLKCARAGASSAPATEWLDKLPKLVENLASASE
mmetsp:Transcript_82485/g.143339  ORF Transcript_82485/g.143339 Transcript_82485/m.143339 type:complete len:93 (+) Transcript_82485:1215-1493(+)